MKAPVLSEVELRPGSRVIADLHLDPTVEPTWRAFEEWLAALAPPPALVVLGDLFEFWIGPAQASEARTARLLQGFARLSCAGTSLHFLHGNRDFLLGPGFERAVSGRVHPHGLLGRLPDGTRVLFLHGDELATRDKSYQRLRRVLRARPVRALAEVLPAPLARALARRLRQRSKSAVAGKSPAYVELQSDAALELATRCAARTLVCGHAHRFRREELPGGIAWIVLDAFGGARDLAQVTPAGALEARSSRDR